MRVTYDAEHGLAYIYLTDEPSLSGRDSVPVFEGVPDDVSGEVILDFKEGQLVGIEVAGAGRMLPRDLLDGPLVEPEVVLASRDGTRLGLTPVPRDHPGDRHWFVSFAADEQSWMSSDAELTIAASHPKVNTVIISAAYAFEGPPVWTASIQIEVDPGAFEQFATSTRELSMRTPFSR